MNSRIFSKNKLSISLLSFLVLIVTNTHAQPPGSQSQNTSTRSNLTNITSSDSDWGDDDDDDDDGATEAQRISNWKDSFNFSETSARLVDSIKNGTSSSKRFNGAQIAISPGSIPTPAKSSGVIPTPPPMPAQSSGAIPTPPPMPAQSSGAIPTPPPMPAQSSGAILTPPPMPAQPSGAIPTRPPLPPRPPRSSWSIPTRLPLPVQSSGSIPTPPPLPSESSESIPTLPPMAPYVPSTEPGSNEEGQELSNSVENTEDSEYYVTSNQELNIDTNHTNDRIKNIYNSGNIIFSKGGKSRDKLIVVKNYTGNSGFIKFNPTAVKNNMILNKFIIKGNSSGLTNVSINDIGGTNSASLNGFELIHVDGLSEGVFNQSGRIVAGAYDYSLVRGYGNNRGNWYLTNQQHPISDSNKRIERPEAASYIANLSASNTLFTTTLSDRLGETQFTDRRTGEKKMTSLWLRQVGNHDNWHDNNNQLKTQSKSYVTMLGGDVMKWTSNGHRRGRLGLMTGYGNNSSNSRSSITNYHSKGSVKGYSVGAYATWFTNNMDKSGLYVDGWIQYNWLNNHVQGQGLPKENYKSEGINAAVETGYTIKVDEFTKNKGMVEQWFIQPQAQITKMGVKAKEHSEANGTRVTSGGKDNIQTRLGIRTYLKGQHAMDKYKNREFEPFIEANWLHNTRKYNTTLDGESVSQAGTRNIGEVRIGIAGKINSKVNIWGNIGTQVADKGYNNTSVTVGVKYNF